MTTISDYLLELNKQRNQLAANLTAMGVPATAEEKLNTLVPKVLEIPMGGGGATKTVLFDANTRENIYLQYNDTVYSLANFTKQYPDFCISDNEYALNYSTTVFGWDYSCYTCSTTPVNVTAATQIAMRFLCGSTETGIMRLVQSDSGTVADILAKAQTEGSYIDLPLQWIYSADYVTVLTPCEDVTAGSYYIVWAGRSNNSHPLVQNIDIPINS
jgi:hypothetical protein